MIEARELRIGNLVMRYCNVMEVSGILNKTVDLILIRPNTRVDWRMLYEDIFPIDLTEEWLLKFGLINSGGKEWAKEDHLDSFVMDKFNDGFSYSAGEGLKLSVPIKYIHQLQNLYFALTGQELTLNPLIPLP